MVELRDEEDGRVALIMDREELPFALEALMRAGYALAPPSEAAAGQTEDEPDDFDELDEEDEPEDDPEEPEAEADDQDGSEEELEDESLDELEDEPEEDVEEEPAEEEPRPARGRSRKARSG